MNRRTLSLLPNRFILSLLLIASFTMLGQDYGSGIPMVWQQPAVAAGNTSIMMSGSGTINIDTARTRYIGMSGTGEMRSLERQIRSIATTSGTWQNLRVQLSADIDGGTGVGPTLIVTLRQDTSTTAMEDKAITCTITGADATEDFCEDISNTVAVVAGDEFAWSAVSTGDPADGILTSVSVEFVADNTGESMLMGGIVVDTASTSYGALHGHDFQGLTTTRTNQETLITTDGTIGPFYVSVHGNLGGGATRDFEVLVNGLAADTELKCQLVNGTPGRTCNDQDTANVEAGDLITVEQVPAGSPGGADPRLGLLFTATAGNVFMFSLGNYNNLSDGTEEFDWASVASNVNQSTTENLRQNVASAVSEMTVTDMYVHFTTAPGLAASGKAFQVTLREDAVDTALTLQMFEVDTTKNDLGESVAIEADHELSIEFTPTSTPLVGGGFQAAFLASVP